MHMREREREGASGAKEPNTLDRLFWFSSFKGTFDVILLPIDFCVAFILMHVHTKYINISAAILRYFICSGFISMSNSFFFSIFSYNGARIRFRCEQHTKDSFMFHLLNFAEFARSQMKTNCNGVCVYLCVRVSQLRSLFTLKNNDHDHVSFYAAYRICFLNTTILKCCCCRFFSYRMAWCALCMLNVLKMIMYQCLNTDSKLIHCLFRLI